MYGKPTTEFPECLKWLTSTQFLANSSQTEFLFYPVTRPSEDGDYQLDMFPMRYVIRRLASFANQHFELEQLRLWPGPLAESGYYYDQDTGSIACYYCRHPPGTHRSTCHWSRCNVPMGSTATAPIQREDLLLMMGVSPKKTNHLQELATSVQQHSSGYEDRDRRLESFSPISSMQQNSRRILADAGFYLGKFCTLYCYVI